ncbi:sigma factor [Genlisea aurea]|uniref:Sigma factor n=1 Tax=Genlisea aurea TaxID=192259 RepID=S8CJI6_9LAMI|nr:sigma factor [Genlisea aurea]
MTVAALVGGLSTGKRLLLLGSAFFYSDLAEKHPDPPHCQLPSTRTRTGAVINARRSSNLVADRPRRRRTQSESSIRALKQHRQSTAPTKPCSPESWMAEEESDSENLVDAVLLLQKSMLEKQWNLPAEMTSGGISTADSTTDRHRQISVTGSGTSARNRRLESRKRVIGRRIATSSQLNIRKQGRSITNPALVQSRPRAHLKAAAAAASEDLLTHSQVVQLSQKIKTGLMLEEHKSRLKGKLGCEPSEEQLANSLRISKTDLQTKLMESSIAREKLAKSNVRLVMSIAQRYDHMGVDMADLIQGGLIGLLRGIEKFDSSKGFKISTYVYWWIRQVRGVSRSLMENSRTLRLPSHLHERLSLIRTAKARLAEKGVLPTVAKIAECLNMSEKKVINATEAVSIVISLDREAFPSLNGLPGETYHSYIADNQMDNNPWYGFDEWALKDEIDRLLSSTLREREREIIRLYYGLEHESLTWEDISRRIGLSRERVRQVGLVALEKLKHAARNKKLDAMLVQH